MIERILQLMELNNIKAFKLTTDLGLSSSAITDWKKGKSKPSVEAVVKISKYFNVSTDYIIMGTKDINTLTENELEMLSLFKNFSNREQIKVIGRLEEWLSNLQDNSTIQKNAI